MFIITASQNGWRVLAANEVAHIDLPGGQVTCHPGDVATVFTHLGNRFHNEVEHLVWPGCWGWADRDVRGSTDISNHASGTAIDLNAPKHPLGTDPMQNYTSGQIRTIHGIVAFYEGVIRWGGDYSGRKDGMHFEINDGITEEQVARIAAKCGGTPAPAPTPPPPAPAPQPTSDIVWETSRYTGPPGTRNVQLGSVGDDVAFVQRWHGIKDDGEFGHDTENHVKETQARNHVTVDGIVGPVTWALMGVGGKPAPAPAPPAPAPHVLEGQHLPSLAFGMTNRSVKQLQAFLNRYNWRPALPLLPLTGYYGPQTAEVLHEAGKQLGVEGDVDGKNFGPHFKDAFWRIGYRG